MVFVSFIRSRDLRSRCSTSATSASRSLVRIVVPRGVRFVPHSFARSSYVRVQIRASASRSFVRIVVPQVHFVRSLDLLSRSDSRERISLARSFALL